jgi:hypothetical protein
MKKFLKVVLLFLIAILSITVPLGFGMDLILRKSTSEPFHQWNSTLKDDINADIVINGSSKAWTQFSPEILSHILNRSVYNLGVDGYGFTVQQLKYDLYRQGNKQPNIIIQVASTNTLTRRKGLYRRHQFLPYL